MDVVSSLYNNFWYIKINGSTIIFIGWPDHVLIPKGTVEGMSFYIFVMISNYDDDLVDGPMNQ